MCSEREKNSKREKSKKMKEKERERKREPVESTQIDDLLTPWVSHCRPGA